MISFHNSLTNKVEPFVPLNDGEVKMYHCGPTVYDYAHIGNLRSYVFADLLRRYFEYTGFDVKQVINITDIGHLSSDADSGDDKMVKGLKRDNLPLTLDGLKSLADKYELAFKLDLEKLNILTPHHFPRATEYLEEQKDLITLLLDKDFAYVIDDGVYFDTQKLESYGRLGGLTPLNESETRVDTKGKKSSRDFVLWKISQDDKLGFDSNWGKGFPGWHIECSAMSRKLLGQPFDIHTGGIDHIPVHHNNEIAQSEAAYDTRLANFWLHNEFLNLSGEKIAKSAGGTVRLSDVVEKGFSPFAYRYFLLLSHYRTPTNFSWEALEAAQTAYRRLKETMNSEEGIVNEEYKSKFLGALENDLNTSQALAVVWDLIKDESVSKGDKNSTLLDFDKVLGLNLIQNEFVVKEIPSDIQDLINEREVARKNKDFAKSDEIRDLINKNGFVIEDSGDSYKISKI